MELGIVSSLPDRTPQRRITVSTLDPECLGVQVAAIAASAPASATWELTNGAIYVPVYLVDGGTVTSFWCYNGAAAAANVDIALYSEAGVRLISAGTTAQAGTNALQTFDTTDTYVPAGRYYLAASKDDATGTMFMAVASVALLKAWGCARKSVV